MNSGKFKEGISGFLISQAAITALAIANYFYVKAPYETMISRWHEQNSINPGETAPPGPIFIGMSTPETTEVFFSFLTAFNIFYWFMSWGLASSGYLRIRVANSLFALFIGMSSIYVFDGVNQTYFNTSMFCLRDSKSYLDVDILYACENAYHVAMWIFLVLLTLFIVSLITRINLSRK